MANDMTHLHERNKDSSDASIGNSSFGPLAINIPFTTKMSADTTEIHGFPRICTVKVCCGDGESYCRSLLLERHGFSIWYPECLFNNRTECMKKGASIGDVGVIDHAGAFNFYFNIFLPSDHPINVGFTPREFKPIEPPLSPSETIYEPDYFKPGTVIASEGVKVTKHGSDPLYVPIHITVWLI